MMLSNTKTRKLLFNACRCATFLLLLFFGLGMTADFSSRAGLLYAQNNNSGGNNSSNNNSSNNNNNNNNNDSGSNWNGVWGRSAVGGLSIDAGLAFQQATKRQMTVSADQIRERLQTIPSGLDKASATRKISLRRLGDLIAQCAADRKAIPDSARFLGGLTAIEQVVAVPADNDIYLVGPAEAWTVSQNGEVVGKTSGKPVLLLEDLLTVLRAWNTETPEVITCSIDPTKEALRNFAAMPAFSLKTDSADQRVELNRQAMGQMDVTFSGIPSTSRMAGVLAGADYRMKRLSLGFEPSPVRALKSYTSMIRRPDGKSTMPRFWLEPKYGTLEHDADQLVWKVADTNVLTLTERGYFDRQGNRHVSTHRDATAERWADDMTKCFLSLAVHEPVFAEAKNCMDIALVVALVYYRHLPEKAHCPLDVFKAPQQLGMPVYSNPTKVDSDSLVRALSQKGAVFVTGGVTINPWTTVENNIKVNPELAQFGKPATFENGAWWAN